MKTLAVTLRDSISTKLPVYSCALSFAICFVPWCPVIAQEGGQAGDLLWQDQFDGTAAEPANGKLYESASALAADGHRIFVVGSVNDENVGGAFTVRSYNAWSGELKWQDKFSGTARGSRASDVVVQAGRIYVAGAVYHSDPPVVGSEDISSAFTVRSYNARTGRLIWQDQFTGTAGGLDFDEKDHANAIAVRDGRVFAVGSTVNQLTVGDFVVRGYDSETGTLLWQDSFDGTAEGEEVDEAYALTIEDRRVFVAGFVENKDAAADFTVRVYDTETGTLLWQDQYNGTAHSDDFATAITAYGGRVFVAGSVVNVGTQSDFAVRSYDVETGKLLWQDQYDGTANGSDSASDVVVSGARVYVVGSVVNKGTGSDFTVRSYHAVTGNLLWQDQFSGTADGFDSAADIIARDNAVYVAGNVVNLDTGSDFTVRAYDAETGGLLWQAQIDGTEVDLDNDKAMAITLRGNNVFTAGMVENENTGLDFTVRVYRAQ